MEYILEKTDERGRKSYFIGETFPNCSDYLSFGFISEAKKFSSLAESTMEMLKITKISGIGIKVINRNLNIGW